MVSRIFWLLIYPRFNLWLDLLVIIWYFMWVRSFEIVCCYSRVRFPIFENLLSKISYFSKPSNLLLTHLDLFFISNLAILTWLTIEFWQVELTHFGSYWVPDLLSSFYWVTVTRPTPVLKLGFLVQPQYFLIVPFILKFWDFRP